MWPSTRAWPTACIESSLAISPPKKIDWHAGGENRQPDHAVRRILRDGADDHSETARDKKESRIGMPGRAKPARFRRARAKDQQRYPGETEQNEIDRGHVVQNLIVAPGRR